MKLAGQAHCRPAVGGFANHLQVFLTLQQRLEALPQDLMIVDQKNASSQNDPPFVALKRG
jgi:hypothetical protein